MPGAVDAFDHFTRPGGDCKTPACEVQGLFGSHLDGQAPKEPAITRKNEAAQSEACPPTSAEFDNCAWFFRAGCCWFSRLLRRRFMLPSSPIQVRIKAWNLQRPNHRVSRPRRELSQ